ncbi:alpha/beta family hydrolase [Photobacterium piscicola]|uniref:alpha/beta family hydrolase n=1 Tax=Photobacterium piscicola TaxID=1378299 RepID=UPI002E18E822|nr:alpha/beta family hydrolase [Photobacterium piscicola]
MSLKKCEYLLDGPDAEHAIATFLFAHGAGAGMDHAFMTTVAQGLAAHNIQVVRFNFPYMIKRAEDGKKRPPDRQPKLLLDFQTHIEQFDNGKLVIGGKSMGGRMASLMVTDIAAQTPLVHNCTAKVRGVACLGFPFHPPAKPENYRGDHLATTTIPTLILQGERDTFGVRSEVEQWSFSAQVHYQFLADGDHGFKPRKASGHTEAENMTIAIEALAAFIKNCVDSEVA